MRAATAFLTTIVIGLGTSIPSSADEAPPLPTLPQAYMQMPWTDFRSLWEALNAAKQKTIVPTPKPPVAWSVVAAEYSAEAAPNNASVKINAKLRVQIWEPAEWVRIPVIGDSVAVTEVTLDGTPAILVSDDKGQLTLVQQGPGEHNVELVFFANAVQKDGVVSFEFPCPETAVTRMRLRVPIKGASVQSPTASNTTVKPNDTGIEADIAFPKSKTIAAGWTLPAELKKIAPPVEPRVACTAWTLAALSETYVSCTTQLRYQVLRGDVDTFEMDFPKGVNVLDVTGQGLAWSQQEVDGAQRVEVKTNHRINENYDLSLTYERPYRGEISDVPLPRPSGVVRETGYVGIAARGNVEISPAANIEGLTRLDAAELPTELRAMSPTPILLAFRHSEGEHLLAVDVRRLQDVAVPDSSIESAYLTTVITDDGMAVTRAAYEVRNSVRQFLRVNVDEKAEIWTALVGDRVVKPARDAKSGAVLIPLSKSVEVDRRLGSFPVELLYMQRISSPKGMWSDTHLTAPATDILASELTWEVLLPETRGLLKSTGDLDPRVSTFAQRETRDAATQTARPTTATRSEKIYRLREGIERFYTSDINNPAASAGGGAARYTGAPLSPNQAGPSAAASSIVGVLPVPISLPETGVPYYFSKILAPQGKTLELTLVTIPSAFFLSARYLAFAVALIGGVLSARLLGAIWKGKPGIRLAVPAIICLSIGVGAMWTMNAAIYIGAICLLAGFVAGALPGLKRHMASA